ncbi:MAG: triose-phosphate isomerase [Deltaproteobacteria bacterium]|nr:triose-phosphate isomerase [Deltaproteobacteria bacterium]
MSKALVVGNWKMNGTITDALKIVTGLEHHLKAPMDCAIAVAPPFTALYSVGVALAETQFRLAAQDCHWEDKGAFTGEVSPNFLKDVGCDYVILGHSERRHLCGETDEVIGRKLQGALRNELTPILCVGETADERERGQTEAVVEGQLKRGLAGLHVKDLEHFAVAYEPVWAIGTGVTAGPQQITDAHRFIRNLLAKLYDAPTAAQIRLLYGGSVKPQNAGTIAELDGVHGFLVGGASLTPAEFADIVRAVEMASRKR